MVDDLYILACDVCGRGDIVVRDDILVVHRDMTGERCDGSGGEPVTRKGHKHDRRKRKLLKGGAF